MNTPASTPHSKGTTMTFLDDVTSQLDALRTEGLYKHEEPLTTAQAAHVGVPAGNVINLCANNYLGLADSPELIAAARDALERWGFGMASVRFICGTQTQHLDLEAGLTRFLRLGAEGFDTILYSSCFDANGGLFETLFGAEDAISSDELNHASIIDGVRLSKAARHRYRNRNLDDLRACLEETRGARHRVIATDGVFSMDGYVAPLDEICALADEYGALVMVSPNASTSSPAPSARLSAGPPGVTPAPAPPSWSCCGSGRGRTCSATPWRRRSSPPPWPPSVSSAVPVSSSNGCARTPPISAPAWPRRDSRSPNPITRSPP